MDAEIIYDDGSSLRLSDIGVTVRDFVISSISLRTYYGGVEMRSGHVDMGASYGERTITVPFLYKANDLHDVALARDELLYVVNRRESFYIRELRRLKSHPGLICENDNEADYEDTYVKGVQFRVRINSDFDVDQVFKYGFGELVFETTELPFAESIGTTSTIDRHGLNYGDGWSYGMGLLYDDESHKYTHTGTSFRIYNAGNVPIHPFEQELKITINNVIGSTNSLELRNKTNGTTFKVNEKVTSGQEIVLDGPNVTSNHAQYLRKTNRKFIELDAGWNEFEIIGADRATVSFDFRFYYL